MFGKRQKDFRSFGQKRINIFYRPSLVRGVSKGHRRDAAQSISELPPIANNDTSICFEVYEEARRNRIGSAVDPVVGWLLKHDVHPLVGCNFWNVLRV